MITSLAQLLNLMRQHGATRIYAKKLAPNDNSKNQVYLGGDFSALNVIPHSEIIVDSSERAGSKQDRPKAKVNFFWVDENARHHAADANLILYPDYPEVRMSGFLKRCRAAPKAIMTVRDPGRVLFMGMTADGSVLGYAATANDAVAKELEAGTWTSTGVFLELPLTLGQAASPKDSLLHELRRINRLQWIGSQRLSALGMRQAYTAPNAGGYTLEAELGITPNGYAEPDFMGWEVKQYGVTDFTSYRPKSPVTLMTPEPNGGVYKQEGPAEFLRRFGYADKAQRADRFNFGGIYTCERDYHADTGLRMTLNGFDAKAGKITDFAGSLMLVNRDGENAASWNFSELIAHWNRKHAQAAYVPSLFRTPPPEYAYGAQVLLCEQTDFILFLKAFCNGTIYYDPAVKIENASGSKPIIKRRSQFRVKYVHLQQLYHGHELVALTTRK